MIKPAPAGGIPRVVGSAPMAAQSGMSHGVVPALRGADLGMAGKAAAERATARNRLFMAAWRRRFSLASGMVLKKDENRERIAVKLLAHLVGVWRATLYPSSNERREKEVC